MQALSIYPQLLTYKEDSTGLCPIVIRVDLNNRKAAIESIRKKIHKNDWDGEKRQVKPSADNADVTNARIRKRIAEIDRSLQKIQMNGVLTPKIVKDVLKNGSGTADFFTFCARQIEEAADSPLNKKRCRTQLNKLKAYNPSLQWADFNFAFFQKYETYLRQTLGNQNNTAWGDFKFMHQMFVVAKKMRIIDHNPLDEYDMPKYQDTIPPYLEWHEVEDMRTKIKTLELPETLRRIAYSFLLQCCTGFRFGDVVRFRWADFVKEGDKNRMTLHTQKNGEIVSIGFTSMIAEVAAVLKDSPLPKITNQDYNRQLKTLSIACQLKGEKRLASHMGRHTFGMRCAELGMGIDDVQKLMGHTNRTTTAIYFRIKSTRLDEAMSVWDTKPKKAPKKRQTKPKNP